MATGIPSSMSHRASDAEILAYVDAGVLRVDPDGSVWRCRKRQVGRGYAKWIDCKPPVRAENQATGTVRVPSCHPSVRFEFPVARLVWLVLCGPIPEGKNVFHRDGSRRGGSTRNNHPSNLFVTERRSFGGYKPVQAVDEELFEFCRSPREQLLLHAVMVHGSLYAAAKELGCNPGLISACLRQIRRRSPEAQA